MVGLKLALSRLRILQVLILAGANQRSGKSQSAIIPVVLTSNAQSGHTLWFIWGYESSLEVQQLYRLRWQSAERPTGVSTLDHHSLTAVEPDSMSSELLRPGKITSHLQFVSRQGKQCPLVLRSALLLSALPPVKLSG